MKSDAWSKGRGGDGESEKGEALTSYIQLEQIKNTLQWHLSAIITFYCLLYFPFPCGSSHFSLICPLICSKSLLILISQKLIPSIQILNNQGDNSSFEPYLLLLGKYTHLSRGQRRPSTQQGIFIVINLQVSSFQGPPAYSSSFKCVIFSESDPPAPKKTTLQSSLTIHFLPNKA